MIEMYELDHTSSLQPEEMQAIKYLQISNIDEINLTENQVKQMFDVIETSLPVFGIPADIFYQKTIPLPILSLNCLFEDGVCNYKIYVFSDVAEGLLDLPMGDHICIGYIMVENHWVFRLWITKGEDIFSIIDVVYDDCDGRAYEVDNDSIDDYNFLKNHAAWGILLWYVIQIYMLNPRTKTIFKNCTKFKNAEYRKATSRERENKRISKYIKHIVVSDELINKALYDNSEKRKINRRCLIWYVLGHWRTYKSGKKIFINGYWKGELRSIKQNLDERERLIDEEVDV